MPDHLLRSALRVLVSQGPVAQRAFAQHVQKQFLDSPLDFPTAAELFPSPAEVSAVYRQYLVAVRCMFSARLAQEALPQ